MRSPSSRTGANPRLTVHHTATSTAAIRTTNAAANFIRTVS